VSDILGVVCGVAFFRFLFEELSFFCPPFDDIFSPPGFSLCYGGGLPFLPFQRCRTPISPAEWSVFTRRSFASVRPSFLFRSASFTPTASGFSGGFRLSRGTTRNSLSCRFPGPVLKSLEGFCFLVCLLRVFLSSPSNWLSLFPRPTLRHCAQEARVSAYDVNLHLLVILSPLSPLLVFLLPRLLTAHSFLKPPGGLRMCLAARDFDLQVSFHGSFVFFFFFFLASYSCHLCGVSHSGRVRLPFRMV